MPVRAVQCVVGGPLGNHTQSEVGRQQRMRREIKTMTMRELLNASVKAELWAHKERVTDKRQHDTSSAGNEIVRVDDVRAERR